MKLFVILLMLPFLSCSQEKNRNEYKDLVKCFYALLYSNKQISIQEMSEVYSEGNISSDSYLVLKDSLKLKDVDLIYPSSKANLVTKRVNSININNTTSFVFKKIRPYFLALTNNLKYDEILKAINNSLISNEGLKFGVYLKLSLNSTKNIYFELDADIPSKIEHIWLCDGTSLEDKIENSSTPQRLLLVGMIEDKDGFSNIREKPSINSKVVKRIVNNQYFFYNPNCQSDWWGVSFIDDSRFIIGFLHKSRILNYSKIPLEMKNKISKERDKE